MTTHCNKERPSNESDDVPNKSTEEIGNVADNWPFNEKEEEK